MRAPIRLILACAIAAGCGDDDDGSDADRSADAARKPDAAAVSQDSGKSAPTAAELATFADDWITAYDREIAATCPCLVPLGAFPSAEECMKALGSGPTWRDCALAAVAASDAGPAISEADARCMIEAREARAACLEDAACDPNATSTCSSMPDRPADCPPLDTDLTVLLLEKCPDLGLLSR